MTETDEAEIRNLIARFAQATDIGTLEQYAACLTEEATMVVGESDARTGRAEIVAAMERNRLAGLFGPASGSMHLVGASVVDVDTSEASASTSFMFIVGTSGQKQVVGTGCYFDRFRQSADGWRLAHRRIHMI